ncbi:DNA-formamidopyrimidine glycosylase, partial [Candidatus Kaiserbacteria bacterium]|nr:DNA-formamidopyrimidine glycosylase [Candidatus Kaiserbacteria bacterium]
MPELPEVETVRIQLLNKVVGKTISNTEAYHAKSINHDGEFNNKLTGKVISNIDRIGKLLIFSFKGEENIFLLAHLKMTGQFFFVENNEVSGGGHTANESDFQDLSNR